MSILDQCGVLKVVKILPGLVVVEKWGLDVVGGLTRKRKRDNFFFTFSFSVQYSEETIFGWLPKNFLKFKFHYQFKKERMIFVLLQRMMGIRTEKSQRYTEETYGVCVIRSRTMQQKHECKEGVPNEKGVDRRPTKGLKQVYK